MHTIPTTFTANGIILFHKNAFIENELASADNVQEQLVRTDWTATEARHGNLACAPSLLKHKQVYLIYS